VTDLTEDGYAEVYLWAECLDPDDGIVETLTLEHHLMNSDDGIYALDNSFELHDNGETILGLEEPGVHFISLWAEDDEGAGSYPSTITVFVVDPAMEEHDEIGIAIEQDWLFYEQGSELQLESLIETTYPEADLEYLWSIYLEDTEMFSSESDPLIDLDQPGVMDISLEVYFANSFLGYAGRTLYVTPEMTSGSIGSGLAKPKMVTQYDCSNPPNDAIVFRKAKSARIGRSLIARVLPVSSRPIMILPGADIKAGDGKPVSNPNVTGTGHVLGRSGDNGGRILIQNWNGDIVLCNGAKFTAGSGADGQNAVATNKDGRSATAVGGHGGKAGSITFITDRDHQLVIVDKGTPLLDIEVTMTLGKGGDGGDATAKGGDGKKDCNSPTNGGRATARAGRGGSMKFTQLFDKTRFDNGGQIAIFVPNIPPLDRTGGDGGNADATGGNGGHAANMGGAACNSCIAGKKGGDAKATGGKGGSAYLRVIKPGLPIRINRAPNGGNGGNATSNGGPGGNASDCPNANNGKDGGKGGAANAKSGKGGKGSAPANNGASGRAGGVGGKGGAGGKGLLQGGDGGDGGKGRGDLANGVDGADGDKVEEEVEATEEEVEATEEPQAQQGSPPVITAVEFPNDNIMNPITIESIGIPADGTEFGGWIHFEDAEGDTSYLSFEPMEVDSIFQGFGFYLEEGFLEGDYFEGKF